MRSWLIARWRVNMATGGYMTIREEIEAREEVILSPYAAKSKFAVRDREEKPDYLRTAFQS